MLGKLSNAEEEFLKPSLSSQDLNIQKILNIFTS